MSHLSKMFKLYITVNEIEQKALCSKIGIGQSTMTRFLKGGDMEMRSFAKLINWLASAEQLEEGE